MLDIQFIRENQKLVEEKAKQKNINIDVNKLLELDEKLRELTPVVDDLRHQRRENAEAAKGQKPSEEDIKKGQQIKDELAPKEEELSKLQAAYKSEQKQVNRKFLTLKYKLWGYIQLQI
jgi:seryl-tRNA synthetase